MFWPLSVQAHSSIGHSPLSQSLTIVLKIRKQYRATKLMRFLFLDLLLPLHTNKHHWVQKHWPFQSFTKNGFVHISVQKIGGIFQTLRALLFTQDLFQTVGFRNQWSKGILLKRVDIIK